jgi:hypothetical protein
MRAVNQYNKAGVKAPPLLAHCITGTQEEEKLEDERVAYLC